MSDVMNLAAGAAAALDRLPRTTFEVPETARTETDPHTVTIRQLTFAEEKAALEAKEHGGGSFEMEGAKRALCAVDGNPLSWTDNQIENVFSGPFQQGSGHGDPRVRSRGPAQQGRS
jgi:hypothetical protein